MYDGRAFEYTCRNFLRFVPSLFRNLRATPMWLRQFILCCTLRFASVRFGLPRFASIAQKQRKLKIGLTCMQVGRCKREKRKEVVIGEGGSKEKRKRKTTKNKNRPIYNLQFTPLSLSPFPFPFPLPPKGIINSLPRHLSTSQYGRLEGQKG